jgi:hypothetical protein
MRGTRDGELAWGYAESGRSEAATLGFRWLRGRLGIALALPDYDHE